jgi:MoaA/NifB/PqqE/SkfB family radical SAM enzyme
MNRSHVIQAWRRILAGHKPLLSIEITRECPLRCPGCYAYEDDHLGGGVNLRSLADYRGDELVKGVLRLVDHLRPLHLSIVGGDPLVRYRELQQLLPMLFERGIYVQLVTSAFRALPMEWAELPNLEIVVSIDGLQPEHDARRKPATYDRILKNIVGHRITVHCTITGQMLARENAIESFLQFWDQVPHAKRIWFSFFTPQRGAIAPEILTPGQRREVVSELVRLRPRFPKLDMNDETIREYLAPPRSPAECIFAQSTCTVSADLKTRITPCQFGGDPDCSQCGCIASMALAGVGHKKFANFELGSIMRASNTVGRVVESLRASAAND